MLQIIKCFICNIRASISSCKISGCDRQTDRVAPETFLFATSVRKLKSNGTKVTDVVVDVVVDS